MTCRLTVHTKRFVVATCCCDLSSRVFRPLMDQMSLIVCEQCYEGERKDRQVRRQLKSL